MQFLSRRDDSQVERDLTFFIIGGAVGFVFGIFAACAVLLAA